MASIYKQLDGIPNDIELDEAVNLIESVAQQVSNVDDTIRDALVHSDDFIGDEFYNRTIEGLRDRLDYLTQTLKDIQKELY